MLNEGWREKKASDCLSKRMGEQMVENDTTEGRK